MPFLEVVLIHLKKIVIVSIKIALKQNAYVPYRIDALIFDPGLRVPT